jgi:LAO/AO transport system kinase
VIVETVGVGQNEFDVMRLADTVVVVLVPEAGDTVQAMKAGLLEIADVFVVNKADRNGAARMRSELEAMLQLRPAGAWTIPVVQTVASEGRGTTELLAAIAAHGEYLARSGDGAARAAAGRDEAFVGALREELGRRIEAALRAGAFDDVLAAVRRGDLDPYAAMVRVLGHPGLAAATQSAAEGPPR